METRRGRSAVPAAEHTVAVLRHLASQPGPVTAQSVFRAAGVGRSSGYAILGVLRAAGLVVHLPEERRYALGLGAFDLGSAYARQAPLARVARPVVARLVDRTGHSGHCAVLHGRDVLYLVEERAPGRPTLVTDVDVRLPAHLTASGRALLAGLSAAQVRALFADGAPFVDRHGTGPRDLRQLREVLRATRARGHAWEDGEVTPGLASVAVPVADRAGHPLAALASTFAVGQADVEVLVAALHRAAEDLARRLAPGGTRQPRGAGAPRSLP